jgi:histidyl-tRNA synthetase
MKFQTPRGTRDFLPEEMIKRDFVINTFRRIFEKYGFENFETPAFENFDLLSAKGSGGDEIKNQIYYFKDKSGRELGLRFDLTVPLARVISSNPQLPKPFKRYCISRVWRYEEVRRDRFREFWQCDIDTIGSKDVDAEAEILAVANEALLSLGFKKFQINLNNRKILASMIDLVEASEKKKYKIFRAIDKITKFGKPTVKKELKKAGLKPKQIRQLLELITIKGSPEKVLKKGEEILQNAIGMQALIELNKIVEMSKSYGFSDKIVIDFSLARGLDYYTGPIFEIVDTSKKIGSLAGGGRYDEIIEKFGGRSTPATGISFGIDRIVEVMNAKKMFKLTKTKTKVFVANVNEDVKEYVVKTAQKLRERGINCQVDLMNRNLKNQLDYANSIEIPYVVIIGPEEIKKKRFNLKNMKTGEEKSLTLNRLIKELK